MNEVSIIINGVRYDAQPLSTKVVVECRECDLYNKDGESECLKLNRCPLFSGYVFKKSDKKFEV
jgi:hypothetical protein